MNRIPARSGDQEGREGNGAAREEKLEKERVKKQKDGEEQRSGSLVPDQTT